MDPNKCQKILSKIDYEAYDDLFEVEKPPKTTDSNETHRIGVLASR